MSADGRYVAFSSFSPNLVPGDTNGDADVFVHDMVTGTTVRVSVDSSGMQGNGFSAHPSISADGRYVAFDSDADNLVPGDNTIPDVFVHDLVTGTTSRVSVSSSGVPGNSGSSNPSISEDGRYVAFQSYATNFVHGNAFSFAEVYVHDMVNGITTCVSVTSSGALGGGDCRYPSITPDGRYVVFESNAPNFVPGSGCCLHNVFVHDVSNGITTRVSENSNGVPGNSDSSAPSVSSDGRYVAFSSFATNLVHGDSNGHPDVFVHDMVNGSTRLVSLDPSGAQGNGESLSPSISADGRYIAFYSAASNLVPLDTNSAGDVFVRDMLNGATTRVSVNSAWTQGDADSGIGATISSNGRSVAFLSLATNLVHGDTNATFDYFVREHLEGWALTYFCSGDGSSEVCPCFNFGIPEHGCDNSASTGGALMTASGTASVSSDTLLLTCSEEMPTALSTVLQGGTVIAPAVFGDGLLCAGGSLTRLFEKTAIGGVITAPAMGERSISARSATLGDAIPIGATRVYQVYYRDPDIAFCPGGFNVTNAIAISWGP